MISTCHILALILDLPDEESWIPDVLDVTCIAIWLLLGILLELSRR